MPLPNLLIIGAMKSGTTSLYMDLASHPQGFLAREKEPHWLATDEVLTPRGRTRYEAIYAKAGAGRVCCDASTGYSKLPDVPGVTDRALEILPEGFRVVYMVRHPIERIISQHHHEHFEGIVGPSIDQEVRRHPRYIQYSQYAYQLDPWLNAIGHERIRVIRFEDYADCRSEALRDFYEFLGLDPAGGVSPAATVYNKSAGKPVKNRLWNAVQRNPLYRNLLRPLAPVKLRLAIRQIVLPKARDRLAPPSPETVAYLHEALRDDVGRLSELLGRDGPLWSDFAGPEAGFCGGASKKSGS